MRREGAGLYIRGNAISLRHRRGEREGYSLLYMVATDDEKLGGLTREALDLLCRLVETPRVSREEKAASDLTEAWLRERGLRPQRIGNNLLLGMEERKEGRETVLLSAHIDTVKPGPSWTRDPFHASVEGGRLYGLGANDDGASLVSLLGAYRYLLGKGLGCNVLMAISAEEEVSGKGGFESLVPLLAGKVDMAIVGEPTGMRMAVAERGLMVLDCVAHGKAGHAARGEGVNAIYVAMEDVERVRSMRFNRRSQVLGEVRATVTIINGGRQHNVVPDECSFTVDVRSNGLYTNEEILETMKAGLESEVRARSTRLRASSIEGDHPLALAAARLGIETFGSETLSDMALMPWPSVKIGPGDGRRSHTADEYVRVEEIERAIPLYAGLVGELDVKR